MLDETVYRCIGASCARSLPRRVNFCPYCGMAQHAGAGEAAQRAAPAVALEKPAAAASPPVRQPASAATVLTEPVAAQWGASPRAEGAGAAAAPSPSASPHAPHSAAPPAAPRAPARPPEREPVRLRWWLLALTVLWLVWIKERPSTNRVDARIDRAIALATDCKAREAQSELIALRSGGATEEQLLRVQQALNEAAAACSRSRQRGRAWRGAEL